MTYVLKLVTIGADGVTGNVYNNASAGLPPSFTEYTCCFWMCTTAGTGGDTSLTWPLGEALINSNGIGANSSFGSLRHSAPGGGNIIAINWNMVPLGSFHTLVPLLISVDTVLQRFSIYVSDIVPPSLTASGWNAGAIINTPGTLWTLFGDTTPYAGIGDFWFDTVYTDFSIESNRRKFVNADLSPVDLGSNGQTPFGTSPAIFLHVPSPAGIASDFATNFGTAGAWTERAPALVLDTDCASSPPPPPSHAILSMDNVIVTCLATESPCTAALFNPTPVVTPSYGLRWSDTRGLTWGNPVPQEQSTDPLSQPQWNRTGYARDRVFELFWSSAFKTAVNGAFVDVVPWKS